MIFWGLANLEIVEVTDFFLTRREAEEARAEILADEPTFACSLAVVAIDFAAGPPYGPN
jgi:hypothetical protein